MQPRIVRLSRFEKVLRPFGLDAVARSRTYRAVRDPAWTFGSRAHLSRCVLRTLHNSQAGESGFIIGTGPSLRETDFDKVKGRPTIGLNRLYLGFQQLGLVPDFLVCVNPKMLEKSATTMESLPCQLVTCWSARDLFPRKSNAVFLRTLDARDFRTQLMDAAATGGTVTYVAMQLAYWLGWSKVTLLGIDHHYGLEQHESTLSPHATVRRQDVDTNHFTSSYFEKGDLWQLPDLRQSEEAYQNARQAFEAAGREIEDGTVGGRLSVFEKSSLYAKPAEQIASQLAR